MKPKSGDDKTDGTDVIYSHIFYDQDFDGRGDGWYFMLSHNKPYGPFPDKDVAITVLKGLLQRLNSGESIDDLQKHG